jgi:hypothetical protein
MLSHLPSTVLVMLFQLPSTVLVMLSELPNIGSNSEQPGCCHFLVWCTCWVYYWNMMCTSCVCVCVCCSVMLCVAERTPTPEVKKATAFPASSHKPLLVDRPPGASQSTQRPLPPTPGDSKLSEKPSGELRTGQFAHRVLVM